MKVFISYRRKDSPHIVDRICDWLGHEFGPASIFKDVESIPTGQDFRQVLQDALVRCNALLAVIGPRWLGETDAAGRRRVDDPKDYVRIEIETALQRKIPVIPLLVDGAPLPRGEDLPPSLQELIYHQATPLRPDPEFHRDMGRLFKALRETSNAIQSADESIHRTLTGHTDVVESVAFAPDGATLASGSKDGTVRLWRVADGSPVCTLEGHTGVVESVAFAPDGATLASGSKDGTVRLWRVADGRPLRTLETHTLSVFSVAFAPDGATLASGSHDCTVRLWQVWDGSPPRTLKGHTNHCVSSVAFAPDGATLASGAWDNTVRLWRVADGCPLRTLKGHKSGGGLLGWLMKGVSSVAFAPDGATLASGAWDKTIRLWRVADGCPLHTLEGHTDWVRSVAFAPDGATLASGSIDKTVRLWQVWDGRPLGTLEEHTSTVLSVAFAPDGATLASGSVDNTVRLWRLRT